MLQLQLVDLLALAAEATQFRWTVRGPSTGRVATRLRSLAEESSSLADDLACHMVRAAVLPNGTAPAQLVASVCGRLPGWWPAPEAASALAGDVRAVVVVSQERADRLVAVAPASAHVLSRHRSVLLPHVVGLSSP